MSARSGRRSLDGLLLLDKPSGITSTAAMSVVRGCCGAKKAGHTGTLDPLATGLLPICFGEATKFSSFLTDSEKSYLATGRLGVVTDSADADGKVVMTRDPSGAAEKIPGLVGKFTGTLTQVPPLYSAIRVGGRRLYEYARAGQGAEVEIPSRQVVIHELTLVDIGADSFTIRVRCSKGTYIRSLIADIGEAAGCGAHVISLRRLSVHGFKVEDAVTIEQIRSCLADGGDPGTKYLISLDEMLRELPVLHLSAAQSAALRHGNRTLAEMQQRSISEAGTKLRLCGTEGFLGVGHLDGDMIVPDRMLAVR